jgi:uncharacterized protein with NRDE domain
MCLILFAYKTHPEYQLILAANRDEFYRRPSLPLGFWPEHPQLLAGKDLIGSGTWLGITQTGRLATITNYRDPAAQKPSAPSRGILLKNFLLSGIPPRDYMEKIQEDGSRYNGFNLLVGDRQQLLYYSNRGSSVVPLDPGVYGLSNHLLDTAWPKIQKGKQGVRALLGKKDGVVPEALFELLSDRTVPHWKRFPSTGVSRRWEKILSPMFITSRTYGTRSSSVLLISYSGQVVFSERSFYPPYRFWSIPHTRTFTFQIDLLP